MNERGCPLLFGNQVVVVAGLEESHSMCKGENRGRHNASSELHGWLMQIPIENLWTCRDIRTLKDNQKFHEY